MASIPLPALGVRPPEQPDPLASVQKMMSLRELIQRGQMNQQSMEANKQDMQIRQQQLSDQTAMTAAMKDWDGKDYDALSKSVLKNGGSANAATQIQQHGLTIKKTISDIAHQDSETGSKNLETFINSHKAIGDALTGIEDVPDDQLHQKALDTVGQLAQAGVLKPEQAQQFSQGIQATRDPKALRSQIDMFAKTSQGAKATAEQEQAALTARKTKADSEHQELENATLKQFGGMSQPMLESKYIALQSRKTQGMPLAPGDEAFVKAYEKNKTLNTQFKFNLEAGGAGGNQPLNPKQTATRDAILEGRETPPSGFALSTPYWQRVMGGVFEADPQWSEQRAELRKDFTVGKHSSEINAINTAMGHVGVLGDAIDAVNNGNVRVLNQIANRIGIETGSTPAATLKLIVHRVGPELSKAYLGSGGSAGERGADEKDFDENLAPQILKTNVSTTAQLLRSKISSLENQWNQNKSDTMPAFQDRFISPEAQKQLQKWSPQSGGQGGASPSARPTGATMKVPGSDGKLHWSDGKQDLGVVQ